RIFFSLDKRLTWMSGSAKAGTIAERHACELRGLPEFAVRAPPKRASGESFSPLTKDLHGRRLTGSYPASTVALIGVYGFLAIKEASDNCRICSRPTDPAAYQATVCCVLRVRSWTCVLPLV